MKAFVKQSCYIIFLNRKILGNNGISYVLFCAQQIYWRHSMHVIDVSRPPSRWWHSSPH